MVLSMNVPNNDHTNNILAPSCVSYHLNTPTIIHPLNWPDNKCVDKLRCEIASTSVSGKSLGVGLS